MPSSSVVSQRRTKEITPWSWPTGLLRRSRDAPSSCWSMACFYFLLWFMSSCLVQETVVITLEVFFYSSTSYHWEGGGSGHRRVPIRQQPHPEVHRSWISRTCTDPVAVDFQRRLSRDFYVSRLSSPPCVTQREKKEKKGGGGGGAASFRVCVCSEADQSVIVNRLFM